ncbi:MAG: hypothetical protein LBB73_09770 [Dysgonamonadaceae bacterium]|jgi:hypothetical protein|nr:hypothetical protein [Dysgonamonadaceae bacterium]
MDSLSEYIPLLIIIASAIISIVRKTKQPAKATGFPEDIFEPEEPQAEKPVPEKKPVTPGYHTIRTPAKKEPAGYKKVVETPEINEYESINIDLSDQEEMKKAIIYSEIFNRKDF